MTIRRWTALPVLAAVALVLMGAGPSVGDRIAAGQQPSPPTTPDPPAPCQDDSAVLVATGPVTGVVFRCVGGVPVPREGRWSIEGCPGADDRSEATLLATPVGGWQPDTACLIATPADGIPGAAPSTWHEPASSMPAAGPGIQGRAR